MSNNKEHLFDEFPPVSTEEWEEVIAKDLRGTDYKEKLRWKTGEGFEILPFYRREDIQEGRAKAPLTASRKDNRWRVCSPIYDRDIEEANNAALKALERGADGLQFKVNVRSTSGMLGGDLEGTSVQSQEEFNRLFSEINLETVSLYFDSGMATPLLLAMLQNLPDQDLSKATVSYSYDPFTYFAGKGRLPKRESMLQNEIADLVRSTKSAKGIKPLCVDARFWHNAGGTIIHEIGLALAAASEYLALLRDQGIKPEAAARAINFSLSVGSKYFPEIAKLRALRLLWRQLLEAYEAKHSIPAYIHAETSTWNKTAYEPHMNMLRSTTEGMAAAIAGVDSLILHPFDAVFKKPNEFSTRIARNAQIVMQEEAYFDKVSDPAAGSYYIEKLTDEIAEKAWALFQDVEQEGGLLTSLQNGTVQTSIESEQKERDRNIATRGRIFVGANQYPNPEEKIDKHDDQTSAFSTVSLLETDYDFVLENDSKQIIKSIRMALSDGAAIGDLIPKLFQEDWSKHSYRTISTYRGTKAFEELRLATEKHPSTPTVLTLPVGDIKMRKARSTFTTNFLGCAGYHINDPIGFESTEEAVSAIKEKEPEVVVICSSDEDYKQWVPELCAAINKLQQKPVTVLAGYPKDQIEEYKKAGIDEFIHAGCNVLETLKNFQQKLGIIY